MNTLQYMAKTASGTFGQTFDRRRPPPPDSAGNDSSAPEALPIHKGLSGASIPAAMLLSALMAPEGHKAEGFGRGAFPGMGFGVGGGIGSLLGSHTQSALSDGNGSQLGAILGLLAGGGLGAYGGSKLNDLVFGDPTWEKKDETEEA